MTTNVDLAVNDTGPKLLLWNAKDRADRPAMREKYLGIWQTWSWSDVATEVQAIAAGLKTLGLNRDDRISIIGDNRPRLYWSIIAAQSIGAIPVPIYQDAVELYERFGFQVEGVLADYYEEGEDSIMLGMRM